MAKRIFLPYNKVARDLIEEGDVLLFRGTGLTSWLLMRAAGGQYSHVALASWYDGESDILECVEFREWVGGRTTNLSHQIEQHDGRIDVYRPVADQTILRFNADINAVETSQIHLDKKAVTAKLRQMTGLPYGWGRIWWLAKRNMFGLRLIFPRDTNDDFETEEKDVYPVCSTAVAYAFSSNHFPLLKNRADIAMEPSNIALSTRLQYLFTPFKDW